jgi:hypothetical protein
MHGLIRVTHRRRQRASARRHFRNGQCAAVLRALAGARLYLDKQAPTLIAAATSCGSNVQYVRAAIILIEDGSLNEQALVLAGHLPLLEAASQVRQRRAAERIPVDEAVLAWRSWTPEQRADFGRGAGISEIWDCAIAPVIATEERASLQAAE